MAFRRAAYRADGTGQASPWALRLSHGAPGDQFPFERKVDSADGSENTTAFLPTARRNAASF
ncbi:hypothetical protein VR45_32610 [Streptomyces sp. NRRL S-495]|nr:hypothetical protein VR45_32610 [Streptomyces sp. NRRL S-495]